jgi:hypothetical protein
VSEGKCSDLLLERGSGDSERQKVLRSVSDLFPEREREREGERERERERWGCSVWGRFPRSSVLGKEVIDEQWTRM